MMSILLGSGAVMITYAMAVRAGVLEPGTVDPFAYTTAADPATETIPGASEVVQTSAPTGKIWQTKALTNLRQVEDLLDSLEACGIRERDVQILDESTFVVRWR